MASVFKRGGKRAKGYYYATWKDHTGKRRTKCTKTTDKATAERIARKFETEAALRREGVIDPALDAISKESQRTIESHLADYESKLRAKGGTGKHIYHTARVIRCISEFAGFAIATDISGDSVNRYVDKMRDDGRSARTIQSHLTAIKGFTKWLAEGHKLQRDPLSGVTKPSPKTDRRIERRMLLPEEWKWLATATGGGPVRFTIDPVSRLLLYRTAIQTGLRSNELRTLTRGCLFLGAKRPYIRAKARNTKDGNIAKQYVQAGLADDLKAHIARKSPVATVFNMPHEANVAKMLREDLAEARQQWINEAKPDVQEYSQRQQSDFLTDVNHEGEIFDFHCLRHTCGAWLSMTGAPAKVVQHVMRHKNISLTMDTYGHLFPEQEADAIDRMRGMLDVGVDVQATGTDDWSTSGAQRLAQRAGREMAQQGATQCDEGNDTEVQKKTPKPLQIADLSDEEHSNACECDSTPSRIRTCDLRIRSPLLYPAELWALIFLPVFF